MKKLNLLLTGVLSATLLLGACGNDESEKKDDSKKSESVEKKKEAPKKSEDKAKETEESKEVTENVSTEEPTAQETVEQPVTQEEPAPVEQQEAPVQEQQQAEPTEQEKMEANAEVAKQNGYTGIPNGDAGSTDKMEEFYQQERAKDLAKEAESEPSEWVKGQVEWNNASESERVEMQKESARLNGDEYDPKDFEVE